MGRVELALPSIDHDEIRKRLLVVEPSCKVASHDFVHRCKVIDPFHRLDLELSIFASEWTSILEPNARGDGVGPLGMRDVEADERARNLLKTQLPLKLVDR